MIDLGRRGFEGCRDSMITRMRAPRALVLLGHSGPFGILQSREFPKPIEIAVVLFSRVQNEFETLR